MSTIDMVHTVTIAVVIGVSNYFDEKINSLPAAQVDAVNFARAIRNWGISESHIALFLNEDATKQNIDTLFERLVGLDENFNLIFYFCGHGYRSSNSLPESFLLLHNSSIQNDQCVNALSLEYIVNKIGNLKAVESYLFTDACYLRINEIINPRLKDEVSGRRFSRKSIFCLLSSGIQESFENETKQYGYFTEALLKALSEQSKVDCSLSSLVSAVNREMVSAGFPLPEAYNIGCQTLSISPIFDPTFLKKRIIYRHELITHIQNVLSKSREKLLCLIGKPGIGKSTLCRALASKKLKLLHVTVPLVFDKSFDPFFYIMQDIQRQSGFLTSSTLKESFHHFEHHFPYYIVMVDQIERLNPKQIGSLITGLLRLKTRFIFFSTQHLQNLIPEQFRYLLVEIEIPPFSVAEGKALVHMFQPEASEEECELIHQLSQGNPLNIKKIALHSCKEEVSESFEFKEDLTRLITAIGSCGLYVNESLFAETFQFQPEILKFAKEIGLIKQTEHGYFPTHIFDRIAEIETFKIDIRKTLDYWYHQLEELPYHLESAKSLIVSLICFGYEPQAEPYLKMAFHLLFQNPKDHRVDFVNAAGIFLKLSYMTEASLILAEMLLEIGEFGQAYALLDKTSASFDLMQRAKFCEVQILGQDGHYKESIELCSELIKNNTSEKMKYYLYRGIVHFILGNWTEAFADLHFVYTKAQDKRYIGRAQCMVGTLMGIRGIDLAAAKLNLETGIQLLAKVRDVSGMWMGWNNLGEILWKCGEYASSAFYLEKALELERDIGVDWVKLETLRNLLHLHLRWGGPFSKEASSLLSSIEDFGWDFCKLFEKMQVLNTLSTAYLFRGDYKRALSLLKMVIPLTRGNREYHIYTLSNLSLLSRRLGWEDKAKNFLNKAIKLAQQEGNLLAIHQIKNDCILCFKNDS